MPDPVAQLQELSELRRRGSLNEKQFETLKERLLRDAPKGALSPVRELEIELAALARHWEVDQEKFRVVPRGFLYWRVPTKNEGTRRARFALFAGGLMTFFFLLAAADQTHRGANLAIWITPLFPIVSTVHVFFSFKGDDRVAEDYERAETQYQAERAQIEARIRALQAT